MPEVIPNALETIRELSARMNEALLQGAIESFIDIADERSRIMKSFFGSETDTGLFHDTITSVIAQDRLWIERLHELLRLKKDEIDQVRRKKSGNQHVARAYAHPKARGRLFIKRG
ncbi:MAG TPA: hypothetical protein DCZ95_07040 [Verrucomicrobia bacterium]|nr:MAG: hypothetical protein A2X46_06260 [Lentisphaerae bacterium GWF2_57_35]HBA83831.1 hypothetical protein [Verrucomicrobiota bacterium]